MHRDSHRNQRQCPEGEEPRPAPQQEPGRAGDEHCDDERRNDEGDVPVRDDRHGQQERAGREEPEPSEPEPAAAGHEQEREPEARERPPDGGEVDRLHRCTTITVAASRWPFSSTTSR